ncbi:MAG TPA: adenylate/guanylate cyclase domain-containing protein, partial [Verrucomicrobiae bacterium]|nr:adenylate/guanylate cyclase domain-containing protein [Verrucomicrobiae bacterium]
MADTFSINAGKQRAPVLLGICALVTAVFFALHWLGFVPLNEADNYVQDWFARLGRKTPADPHLVLVGIDRPTYDFGADELRSEPLLEELNKSFPWSRAVWARVINQLGKAGTKAIVFDLVFAGPNKADDELKEALEEYKDRVVIGYDISTTKAEQRTFLSLQIPNSSVIDYTKPDSPVEDDRLGYVHIWPDADGILRRAYYRITGAQFGDVLAPNVVIEALAARALRKFGRPDLIPKDAEPKVFRYTAPPGLGYKVHPIGDVLSPKTWASNYRNGEFFRDKIVLIGPTATVFQDIHSTPLGSKATSAEIVLDAMPGPEIHLNIINAALHGEFLRELSPWSNRGLIALAGMIAVALCRFVRQPVKRLLVILALSGGYLLGAFWLFNHANLVVLVVSPVLVMLTSGLAALAYDFVVERLERMKLRHTMGLYFSPRVLEAVLDDPGSMKPRRADVTLLLTDLRNSTPLAEALGPKGMFELLNRVFEVQTNAIMGEEGNLEHFLGDQFLSYWGAPQSQPDAADRAGQAATKLIAAMEQLRGSLPPEVQKLFGYGVALHSGSVLVGNKGSA